MSFNLPATDSLERQQNAVKILNILSYVQKSAESQLFDCGRDRQIGSDSGSDLGDPFGNDDDEPSADRSHEEKQKRVSKQNTDMLTSFSKEYRKTEEEILGKMNFNNSHICTEDLSIKATTIDGAEPEEDQVFVKNCNELLSKAGLDVWKAKKEQEKKEKEAKNKNRETGNVMKKFETTVHVDNVDSNSMSGIWRMLDGQSVENGFPITEIGYSVLNDKRLDWLNRADLTYEQKEEARIKCEKWIKKCNL